MRVLITGATGLVGREVGKKLVAEGHEVFVVSRDAEKAKLQCPFPCEVIEGQLEKEAIRDSRLVTIEAVIHLAGESVAEARWSAQKKLKIYNSRVKGTAHLIESLKDAPLKVFVSTSASGYYGDRKDEILNEDLPRGAGFLAEVCEDWERPVLLAENKRLFPKCRFSVLRVGVVLTAFGGALQKMIPLFQQGLGGAIGDGSHWMSWIHLEDLSNLYLECLKNENYAGVFDAVAPEPVQNLKFSEALAKALGKKLLLPVPELALKAAFGEMSHVLLSSQRIEARHLIRKGFAFLYPNLEAAFKEIGQYFTDGEMTFRAEQYLPYGPEAVFPFFAEAKNLEKLTPPILNFTVLKMSTEQIQSGSMIDYKLKIHGVPVRWRTEILDWQPPKKFTDTQLKGPYSKWHHTHEFKALGKGTLMTDLVRYRLPMGALGRAVAGHFVTSDVRKIFDYRKQVCAELQLNPKGTLT